jgi:NADH dehydrogenase
MVEENRSTASYDVIIAGGGFAGAYCAKHLSQLLGPDSEKRIALIAEDNVLAFQPMLAEVVGASLSPLDVVTPLREFCPRANVLQGKITRVDLEQKAVELEAGHFTPNMMIYYQHLVLAVGGIVNVSSVPGMAEHGYILKDTWDALRLRVALIGRLEEANLSLDAEVKKRLLTFVIVGGGYSGVETAGQILDLVEGIKPLYHNLSDTPSRVVLVHSRDFLLPEIGEKLGRYAETKLRERGMEILLNRRVTSVSARRAYLDDGARLETNTVLSTVGNAPHPLIVATCQNGRLENIKGRVTTDPYMRVKGRESIWAMGDCAAVPNEREPSCPPTAQFALRQGLQGAENIFRVMNGGTLRPFRYKSQGQLASIGHRNAVADIMGFHFSGIFAWFIWRSIYLFKLPGIQRKLRVMIAWTLDLFFPRDISVVRPEAVELIQDMHFDTGDVIFQNNDPYRSFYIVRSGKIDYARTPIDHEILGEGDLLGGPHFTRGDNWTGHGTAAEPVKLTCVNRRAMQTLFASKDIARRFGRPEETQTAAAGVH